MSFDSSLKDRPQIEQGYVMEGIVVSVESVVDDVELVAEAGRGLAVKQVPFFTCRFRVSC